MGNYFDAETVETKGRQIGGGGPYTYDRLRMDAGAQRIVAIYDRDTRKLAVEVTDRNEFQEFEGQYNAGFWLRRKFYAVSSEVQPEG